MRTELLLAMVGLALLAPPAVADGPGIELSRDGRSWSSALSAPLLDEDVRIVPGGATRSDLWLRNSSGRSTTLTVATGPMRSTMPEGVSPLDDFRVRVGGTGLTSDSARRCVVVVRQTLDPGERVRVPVSVALPSTSRRVSERRSVAVPLRLHLTEGGAADACSGAPTNPTNPGTPTNPADPPETPGSVQTDGGPWEQGAVADLGLVALLSVALAVALRRRAAGRRGRRAS